MNVKPHEAMFGISHAACHAQYHAGCHVNADTTTLAVQQLGLQQPDLQQHACKSHTAAVVLFVWHLATMGGHKDRHCVKCAVHRRY